MNKYGMYIATVLLMSFLSACSDSTNDDSSAVRTIEVGEEVFVGSGDSISPDTEETEVIVSHYLNNTKSVRVIKGSVTLFSGNYEVK